MIHEIAPHRYENAYRPRQEKLEDYVIFCENRKAVLLKEKEGYGLPKVKDFPEKSSYRYLFSIDDTGFFFWKRETREQESWLEESLLTGKLEWCSGQVFRSMKPRHLAFGGITGMQMAEFANRHRFCGKCGGKMIHSEKERAYFCGECGNVEYPKISPAIIVAIQNGDKLLLTRYAQGEYKKYALVAGFMEIGETIEDTVRREVMEEVGLQIKNLRYYKSQPWSFSDSLMIGYFAELSGKDTIVRQEEELSEALWVKREDILQQDAGVSIGGEMIELFRTNQVEMFFQNRESIGHK